MIRSFTKAFAFVSLILAFTYLNSCSKKSTPNPGTGPDNLYGKVSTFAGSGATGSANGAGIAASFFLPSDIVIDASGNFYVADSGNNMIRKITPDGVVSQFVGNIPGGSADGTGSGASFHYPYSLAIDAAGNLYLSDQGNQKIRKITPAGVVTTLAGTGQVGSNNGPGDQATFYGPTGITVDATGNVYVSDQGNNLIRKITPAGVVSTLAGSGTSGSADGTGSAASFYAPAGLAIDATGNIYVADLFNNKIRKITSAGVVTTLAGSGTAGKVNATGAAASFYAPAGITVATNGIVYVAESGNNLIRAISPAGEVTTFAGNGIAGAVDATLTLASFNGPTGLVVDASNNVYVSDKNSNLIRKIVPF